LRGGAGKEPAPKGGQALFLAKSPHGLLGEILLQFPPRKKGREREV